MNHLKEKILVSKENLAWLYNEAARSFQKLYEKETGLHAEVPSIDYFKDFESNYKILKQKQCLK